MKDRQAGQVVDAADEYASEDLAKLLAAPIDAATASTDRTKIDGVVVGALVGFADAGAIPLVTYRQQPGTAAVPARSTVALHASHIGKQAALMFEEGDPQRPIIVGCLQDENATALPVSGQVQVEADGQRLVVSATDRIVLRCGKASITLTKEGKVVIQGAYVSNQSSGVLRLKGGSVQIN
ncbi:MAG TPA: DUF6484 domain-containing protein [Vicinamibacterales bacterium]|jgi:hypothetical protein